MGRANPVRPTRHRRGAARRAPRGGRIGDVGAVFREEFARSVATLARILGDLDLAEDAVQGAFAKALERWPRDGEPANPGAWILTTARNHAIDQIRRERTLDRKAE